MNAVDRYVDSPWNRFISGRYSRTCILGTRAHVYVYVYIYRVSLRSAAVQTICEIRAKTTDSYQ